MKSIYLATAYSYNSNGKYFKLITKLVNHFPFNMINKLFLTLRYRKITKICAHIMAGNNIVFSPITHSHPVAMIGKLPALSHTFWLRQDKFWVDACDEVWVYKDLPYWTSYGVQREIEWALNARKPVRLVGKDGLCTEKIVEFHPITKTFTIDREIK